MSPDLNFRRIYIKQLHGNLTGLKPSQIKGLERLYRRRIPPSEVLTAELARAMADLSLEIRRQIGVLVNRVGEIVSIVVGDERSILIPELTDYPLGRRLLRGLRLIHTHLRGEPLSEDDLTDLAMLRLDLIAALLVPPAPSSPAIQIASLESAPDARIPCRVEEPCPLSRFRLDFADFVKTLEGALEKGMKREQEVKGGKSGGFSSR